MKLVGLDRSPYVRRVAVSLNILNIDYENVSISPFDAPQEVSKFNPLTRIPTLILDNGDVLVESYAILDALDDMSPDEKRLVPPTGEARRSVMQLSAVATGTMDKAVWSVYEGRFHPKEKYHKPWVEHNDAQVQGGLAHLDQSVSKAGCSKQGWLGGAERISQADISATVAFTFTAMARPSLNVQKRYPMLAEFASRMEANSAFSSVSIS